MYTGNNPTAIYSIDKLIESLISLMKENPYNKITIKKICDRAELARQTFYNFFEKKDDLLYFYLRKLLNENKVNKDKLVGFDEYLTLVSDRYHLVFEENIDFFKLLIKNELDGILKEVISKSFEEKFFDVLNGKYNNKNSYYQAYFTGAFSNTIIHWLKDSNRISSKEFTKTMNTLLNKNFYEILGASESVYRFKQF